MPKKRNDKKFYTTLFVILVYRNTDDIQEMIDSINRQTSDSKVIIVNSYYDDSTRDTFCKIAESNGCDFINVPNRGYGYGNNRGIELALQRYNFDILIVANPDMVIEQFSLKRVDVQKPLLICPLITAKSGKQQNPFWVIKSSFSEWLMFTGHKRNNRLLVFSGIAIHKIMREAFLIIFRSRRARTSKVYAAHGSFIIFTRRLLESIKLPFDENMFLFSEEMYLARRLRAKNINAYLTKDVRIFHKEDGSMNLSKIDESSESTKSYMYYYGIRKKIDAKG